MNIQPLVAPVQAEGGVGAQGRIPAERKKELFFLVTHMTGKVLRCGAHDDMRDAIQRQRAANDVGISI